MAYASTTSGTDHYELFELLPGATTNEVKQAYRKKALTCHPDKHPDDPLAAKRWEELSQALEILTNSEARAAYDKILKAKKANELRNRALEGKRRKVKEDLERREAASRSEQAKDERHQAAKLEQVIRRLQEEGSIILAEEQRLLKEQIKNGGNGPSGDDNPPRLKVKWKSKKQDEDNGGYSYSVLHGVLRKYGPIPNLLVSSKRKGSAIVEYESSRAAELAVCHETGLKTNPLQLSWLSGRPARQSTQQSTSGDSETDFESSVLEKLKNAHRQQGGSDNATNTEETNSQHDFQSKAEKTPSGPTFVDRTRCSDLGDVQAHCDHRDSKRYLDGSTLSTDTRHPCTRDYESVVMMNMRQAQERRRLIEQMSRDETDET